MTNWLDLDKKGTPATNWLDLDERVSRAFHPWNQVVAFFEALSNHKTHEYKDLQLLLALVERFWDTTCTFHFSNIGELMLTPYDFFVITGLRLGGK